MIWQVEFTRQARKDLGRLPPDAQRRIARFLSDRVAGSDDPRNLAKRLTLPDAEIWRFRVGDYRLLAQFEDAVVTILIVEIGHRREVYRR